MTEVDDILLALASSQATTEMIRRMVEARGMTAREKRELYIRIRCQVIATEKYLDCVWDSLRPRAV